jgi:cobalamin synthase
VWLLEFLPDWIFHAVLVVGVMAMAASFVLKFVPFVTVYRLPIQAVGLVLTVLGVWFQGAMSNEAAWQARVHEMEQRVATAEVKSAQENVRIVTQVVTRIQTIKDTTNANTQYLEKQVAQDLDRECSLTNASVMLHNSASQNEMARSAGDTAGAASEVKASELIGAIVENYGTYYQVVERLKGWQDWYRAQKTIFEQIK